MKSKAPLFLIELLIMLLVFSAAAALCLKAFSKAESISIQNEMRTSAVANVKNTAEKIKSRKGFEAENSVVDCGEYRLFIEEKDSDFPLLGIAEITAIDKNGNTVFAMTASYQKEAAE